MFSCETLNSSGVAYVMASTRSNSLGHLRVLMPILQAGTILAGSCGRHGSVPRPPKNPKPVCLGPPLLVMSMIRLITNSVSPASIPSESFELTISNEQYNTANGQMGTGHGVGKAQSLRAYTNKEYEFHFGYQRVNVQRKTACLLGNSSYMGSAIWKGVC